MNSCVLSVGTVSRPPICIVKPLGTGWLRGTSIGSPTGSPLRCGTGCGGGAVWGFLPGVNSTVLRFLR